jgi:hypothetical protein
MALLLLLLLVVRRCRRQQWRLRLKHWVLAAASMSLSGCV